MKIYQSKNVYETALERIEFIYNEFPNVIVSFSGGKDSTVLLHLCIEVARKIGRLPVIARFLDQEAEWRQTVEYMRLVREMPEVDLRWYQVEINMTTSTSTQSDVLHCWKEGEEWMRPKEPGAITDSYGIKRFHEFMRTALDYEYPNEPACAIAGMRADESPQRARGLTNVATYKHITYGSADNRALNHYSFYPMYDWTTKDVWHYIAVNKLPYNEVYDLMYRNGMSVSKMRVSNLIHETAIQTLSKVQAIDAETWDMVVGRLDSANAIKHLKDFAIGCPRELPTMFRTWKSYRDYLMEKLIVNEENRAKMVSYFALCDKKYEGTKHEEGLYRAEVDTVIKNDFSLVKIKQFMSQYDKIEPTKKRIKERANVGQVQAASCQ